MPSPSTTTTERVRIEFFKELYGCVPQGKLSETCVAFIQKHPDLLVGGGGAKCPPSGFQIEERRFVRDGFTTRYKTITRWCGLTATECMCEEVQQDDCGGAHTARDLLLELIEAGAPVTDQCYNLGAKTTDGITNIYIVEALLAGGYVPLLQQQQRQSASARTPYFFLDGMVESVGNGDWDFDDEDDLEALACDELHGVLKILNKQVKVGDPCSFGKYSQTVVHNVKTKLPNLKPSVGGVWSMCGVTHSPDGPFAAVQETWLRLNGMSMSNVEESEDDSDSDDDSDDQEEDEEVGGVELEEAAVENSDRGESVVEEDKEEEVVVQEEDKEEEVVGSGSSNDDDDDDEEEDHDDDDSDYDEKKKQKVIVVRKASRRGSNDSICIYVGGKRKRKRNSEEDERKEKEETRSSHDDSGQKHAALTGSGGHIQNRTITTATTTTTTSSSSKNTFDNVNTESANISTNTSNMNDTTTTNNNNNTDFYGIGGFYPAGCAVHFPKNEHWNSAMLAYDVMTSDVTACVRHNNGTVERMQRQDIEIVPIDSGRPSRRRRRC